jgi:transposase
LRALDRGERPTEIARRFEVSRMWGHQGRDRLEKEGRRDRLPMGGYRKSRLADREPQIRAWRHKAVD